MAIRRLNKDSRSGRGDRRSLASVSTLPTLKAGATRKSWLAIANTQE